MSLSWPAVVGTAINMNVGALGAVGSGSYTIVALTNLGGANHGVIGLSAAGSFEYQVLSDSGSWYGGGDFSGFTGTPGAPVVGDWQIIGQSKTGGSNTYRWHFWDYTTNSAKVHTAGSGAHNDPGTITGIQLGNAENRGNGLIAAIAVWKRVLSDAEFDSLCTTSLADWMTVSGGQPDAIWALNVAAASVVDGTGNGANAASVTGTVSAGADPPGFNYALSAAAPATSPGRLPPPQLIGQLAAARAAQFRESAAAAVTASGSVAAQTHPSTGATGAKTGTGAGTALTHPATATAGQKTGSGVAAPQVRPATGATGQKTASGTGAALAHPTVTETGRKVATGAGSASAHATVTVTGFKVATGAAAPVAHPNTRATGLKVASAAGAAVGRPATGVTGAKTATGTAVVIAHPSVLAVSGHIGAAVVSAHAVVTATGFKVATGAVSPAARGATTATGRHVGSGAATAYAHPAGTTTGRKLTTGGAAAQALAGVAATGGPKAASGTARVVGHVTTLALAGVPEVPVPAGVTHLVHVTPGPLVHVTAAPLVHVSSR